MDEFWATRTGRWRTALRRLETPTMADRLYVVVRKDIEQGMLPAGAALPSEARVADELGIGVSDVRSAFGQLKRDGVVQRRADGALTVPVRDAGDDVPPGDATQLRLESALLQAVREAAAQGLRSDEATGLFKAAMRKISEGKGSGEYGED